MAPPKAEDKSERPDARILDCVLKREKRDRATLIKRLT